MAKGASLDIKLDATGNAVAELKRVQAAMKRNEKQLKKLTAEGKKSQGVFGKQREAFKRFGGTVDKLKSKLASMALGVAAIGVTAKVFKDMVVEGAKSADMFDTLSAGVEKLPALITRVRAASAGMIDRQSIVAAAAEFKAFGLDVQQLPQVMGALAATSVRTGKDMGFLTSSLIEGISKSSDMRLDNLGLIGVFKNTRAELDAQGVAYGDAALKTAALSNAVQQLTAQNADIDLMSTRTSQLQRWSVALADLTTNLQEAAYEGAKWWGILDGEPINVASDALEDMAEHLLAVEEGTEGATGALRPWIDALGPAGAELQKIGETLDTINPPALVFAENSGKVAAQLDALSAAQRLSLFDKWDATLRGATTSTRNAILALIGNRAELHANAVAADRAANATAGLVWWQQQLAMMFGEGDAKGGAAKKPTATKPTGGGGGGGSSRRAAKERAREQILEARKQLQILKQQEEFGRLIVRNDIKRMDLEEEAAKKAAESKDIKGTQVWLETKLLELDRAEDEALASIDKHQDEIFETTAKQNEARTVALEQVQAIHSLSALDREIAAAREPLERAALELQRARLEAAIALKQLGGDENAALVERAEILERLRDAQDGYNAQVEKINRDELADQLRGVSRAAQGVASQMDQIDSSMTPAITAVGASADAWARYAEGQDNVATALANTAGAVGIAAQSFVDDEETKAAIAALMQIAYSAAAFASQQYAQGAAHLAAAGLFTAIAAGAGGGGGGGGAGGGTAGGAGPAGPATPPASEGAGDRRIIVQFHGGVLGSPQDVAKSIQKASHSARGSGSQPGW